MRQTKTERRNGKTQVVFPCCEIDGSGVADNVTVVKATVGRKQSFICPRCNTVYHLTWGAYGCRIVVICSRDIIKAMIKKYIDLQKEHYGAPKYKILQLGYNAYRIDCYTQKGMFIRTKSGYNPATADKMSKFVNTQTKILKERESEYV